MFRGRIWLLLALSLGLGACTGAPTAHMPSGSRPSASATVVVSADPQRCARLAKKGFTPCPPTPDRLQLPPTTIKNATNGAISDTTAQEWGRAFQLTEAYYRWAIQHVARSALTSGAFADSGASVELFAPDLSDIDAATAASSDLIDRPPKLAISQLVPIPPDLQDRIRRQNLQPTPYGFAIRLNGPASRSIRNQAGGEKLLWSVDDRQVQSLLVWGQYKIDPDLGNIWFEYGLYGCDGVVQVACQL